jgi:hypothetical protein
MAKYLQGINGVFIGKVGTVVGCVWKGIPYMRAKGRPRTSGPSEKEENNRNKFKTAHAWLQPLLDFLRTGFAGYGPTSEGFNAAKSYNLKNAMIQGEVMPGLVKVSYGDLPLSEDLSVALQDNKLHFSWSAAYIPETSPRDQVMLLAYHPESRTAIYDVHGAFRNMGNQIMDTYNAFLGKTVHVYAAFISADRTKQSNSQYLGAIDC